MAIIYHIITNTVWLCIDGLLGGHVGVMCPIAFKCSVSSLVMSLEGLVENNLPWHEHRG